jgi:hypothetical protein
MHTKLGKAFTFSEQIASSGFNFIVVILLSKMQSGAVASFGLVYSFALVYVALIKNGALNAYLTNGNTSIRFYLSLLKRSIINIYSNGFLIFLALFGLLTNPELGLFIPVFLFYIFIEINRVYLFSIQKEFMVFGTNAFSYLLIFSLIYAFSIEVKSAFLFGVLIQIGVFVSVCLSRLKYCKEESIEDEYFNGIGKDSFLLTASYSAYAHGPLWILYIISDDLAKLLIQIRNLFQPVQMLSRVIDMYEKRRSGSTKYSYSVFQANFKFQLYCALLLSGACALIGYSVFEYAYGSYGDINLPLLISVYAIICILTFLSKPIETYFYKIKDLKPIIKSRIIASVLIIMTSPFLYFYQSDDSLIILLLTLSVIWSVILVRNYLVIMKLAHSQGER